LDHDEEEKSYEYKASQNNDIYEPDLDDQVKCSGEVKGVEFNLCWSDRYSCFATIEKLNEKPDSEWWSPQYDHTISIYYNRAEHKNMIEENYDLGILLPSAKRVCRTEKSFETFKEIETSKNNMINLLKEAIPEENFDYFFGL